MRERRDPPWAASTRGWNFIQRPGEGINRRVNNSDSECVSLWAERGALAPSLCPCPVGAAVKPSRPPEEESREEMADPELCDNSAEGIHCTAMASLGNYQPCPRSGDAVKSLGEGRGEKRGWGYQWWLENPFLKELGCL